MSRRPDPPRPAAEPEPGSQRLDKWLWFARFFKSRSLATAVCAAGGVRLDSSLVDKAHAPVRVGQVLTFVQGRQVRVVRVRALGSRRGPAPEAEALYEDLTPPAPRLPPAAAPARPGKRERREALRLKTGQDVTEED